MELMLIKILNVFIMLSWSLADLNLRETEWTRDSERRQGDKRPGGRLCVQIFHGALQAYIYLIWRIGASIDCNTMPENSFAG